MFEAKENEALKKILERENDRIDQAAEEKMNAEIEEAKAQAEEEIRKKYREHNARPWNEDETRKAYKDFVKQIRKE